MRYTTRALRALRQLVSLHEYGFLHALIDSGLSYDTGRGSVSYGAVAKVAKISRRQAMRYTHRLVARGLLEKTLQYRVGQRPLNERNRANLWGLPLFGNVERIDVLDRETEAFLDATHVDEEGEDFGAAGAPGQSDDVTALDAAANAAPFELDVDTQTPIEAAARVATASSVCYLPPEPAADAPAPEASPAPPASQPTSTRAPANDQLGPEATSVFAELGTWPELASIANPSAAARIWGVAKRYRKNLATTLVSVRDAADKAAGRTGPALESLASGFVRTAREVAEVKKKTPDETARERQTAAELQRMLDERGEADRQRKRRASQALAAGRGPPPPDPSDQ